MKTAYRRLKFFDSDTFQVSKDLLVKVKKHNQLTFLKPIEERMELIVKLPKFQGFDNIYLIPSTEFSEVKTIFYKICTTHFAMVNFSNKIKYVLVMTVCILIFQLLLCINPKIINYISIRMDLIILFSTERTSVQFWLDPFAYRTLMGSCIVPITLSMMRIAMKRSVIGE